MANTAQKLQLIKELESYDLFFPAFHLHKQINKDEFTHSGGVPSTLKLFTKLPCAETVANILPSISGVLNYIKSTQESLIHTSPEESLGSEFEEYAQRKELAQSNLKVVSDIQAFLLDEAISSRAMIGFHRMRNQKNLLYRLSQIGVKKSLFRNTRQFLREEIITSLSAFRAVTDMVCIHSAYDGREIFWNGFGEETDGQHHLASEILFEIDLSAAHKFLQSFAKSPQ